MIYGKKGEHINVIIIISSDELVLMVVDIIIISSNELVLMVVDTIIIS
jgi:hypothetical protein